MIFKDFLETIEIDLTKPLEELWQNLDKDARWGVNKARKEGLSVKEDCNETEIKSFYELYKNMCINNGVKPYSYEDFLNPVDYRKKRLNAKTIICEKEGKIIAGASFVEDFEACKVGLSTNASVAEYLKFQPNNLLYWTLIEYAKKKGFKILDLGGYQTNAKQGSKLYQVNRFKERWAGKIVKYPVYNSNPFYIIGRKLIRRFSFIRKIINKMRRSQNEQ